MRDKPKHDYSIFTKDELIKFLRKQEKNFLYIESPYDIMLDCRMDETMKKMEKCAEKGQNLSNRYQKNEINGLNYIVACKKHNEKYDKLLKEYDRLSELRFGHLKY